MAAPRAKNAADRSSRWTWTRIRGCSARARASGADLDPGAARDELPDQRHERLGLSPDDAGGGARAPALAAEAGYATLNYGNFIQTVLDFLIIALAIFLVIKLMATAKSKPIHEKPEEPEPKTEKTCPFCCTEIPIDAVKCPHCTSDLPEDETEAEEE